MMRLELTNVKRCPGNEFSEMLGMMSFLACEARSIDVGMA